MKIHVYSEYSSEKIENGQIAKKKLLNIQAPVKNYVCKNPQNTSIPKIKN